VNEILNYISAWVTLLASVLALCVFLFDLVSKKNLFSTPRGSARQIKKGWFSPGEEKKLTPVTLI
jgi:hypothetical protein